MNWDDGTGLQRPALLVALRRGPRVAGLIRLTDKLGGDGFDEIVTGAGPGVIFGAHVRAWDHDGSGISPMPDVNFFAYDSVYGVVVGASVVDTDGLADRHFLVAANRTRCR